MSQNSTDLNTEKQRNSFDLEVASAVDRVRWAKEEYGDGLVLSTSFGVQSAVMLHLVTQQIPDIPVVFVDTGYLFPETYRFAEELTERLNLNLKTYQPLMTAARQEALYGKMWEDSVESLDRYNNMNKVEPMNRAMIELGAKAWLSGLRRDQSSTRQERPVAQKQNKIWKVYPIIDWNDRDVYVYLTENALPYHPLWNEGYVSLGDWHSTSKLTAGMSAQETRFGRFGEAKRECGLHNITGGENYQI